MAGGILAGLCLLAAAPSNAQIFHKKKKIDKSTSADNNAQPDKILYDRAVDDIKHGRQEIGRLNMQTLINTYPDSEYLAKAKLAIADSYYKEGGTSNLTLAISGYKDFEVFFPFLPEATYAQMQVAMAHYRQMEKPDRDRTQAVAAEEEFQTFIEKYPNDPLAPQATQHLREVQEVLAEGDYRIGYYYYLKGDKRAAATRLLTVTSRYPLYSRSDRALWMMGDIFEKSEHKDVAARYYTRIVKDYPLSSTVPDAKARLKALGAPIPQADPTALAWMTAEQNTPREKTSMVKKPMSLFKNGPGKELLTAARTGAPDMQPESDSMSAADLLTPGGDTKLGGKGGGRTSLVTTVTPGGSGTAETTGGSENVAPTQSEGGADVGTVGATPAASDAPKETAPNPTPEGAPATAPATAPPAVSPADGDAAKNPPATETPTKSDPATAGADSKSDTAAPGTEKSSDAQTTSDAKNTKDDKDKKESSSKKKGLRKLIPW
ncbi:MAG: outer membrane protein assembly factor BamD [Candidatus Acidiferrum sp.]